MSTENLDLGLAPVALSDAADIIPGTGAYVDGRKSAVFIYEVEPQTISNQFFTWKVAMVIGQIGGFTGYLRKIDGKDAFGTSRLINGHLVVDTPVATFKDEPRDRALVFPIATTFVNAVAEADATISVVDTYTVNKATVSVKD